MSGDIIGTIDRALEDYGTSLDAMRWTPDVPDPEPEAACPLCQHGLPHLVCGWRE